MQVPFPIFDTPDSGVPLPYPIQLRPPYDPGASVARAQASMDYTDSYNPSGGAWYNDWGDFKSAVSGQFTDPNSYLRSGRFGNAVESFVNPATDALAGFRPEYAGVATGIQRGLRQFRDLTGLGIHGGKKGVKELVGEVERMTAQQRSREEAAALREQRRVNRVAAQRYADQAMGAPAVAAAAAFYPPNPLAPPVSKH
jgi:hypothetical protein